MAGKWTKEKVLKSFNLLMGVTDGDNESYRRLEDKDFELIDDEVHMLTHGNVVIAKLTSNRFHLYDRKTFNIKIRSIKGGLSLQYVTGDSLKNKNDIFNMIPDEVPGTFIPSYYLPKKYLPKKIGCLKIPHMGYRMFHKNELAAAGYSSADRQKLSEQLITDFKNKMNIQSEYSNETVLRLADLDKISSSKIYSMRVSNIDMIPNAMSSGITDVLSVAINDKDNVNLLDVLIDLKRLKCKKIFFDIDISKFNRSESFDFNKQLYEAIIECGIETVSFTQASLFKSRIELCYMMNDYLLDMLSTDNLIFKEAKYDSEKNKPENKKDIINIAIKNAKSKNLEFEESHLIIKKITRLV